MEKIAGRDGKWSAMLDYGHHMQSQLHHSCEDALHGLFILHALSPPVCLVWPLLKGCTCIAHHVCHLGESFVCYRCWGGLLLCMSALSLTLPSRSLLISPSPLLSLSLSSIPFCLLLFHFCFLSLSTHDHSLSPFPFSCTNLFSYFCGQPTFA